jgi:hypothetical protein
MCLDAAMGPALLVPLRDRRVATASHQANGLAVVPHAKLVQLLHSAHEAQLVPPKQYVWRSRVVEDSAAPIRHGVDETRGGLTVIAVAANVCDRWALDAELDVATPARDVLGPAHDRIIHGDDRAGLEQ